MEKNIMEPEKLLPADFDGTFRFTNPSDEDFVGKWNSKEYRFPAKTTSPMIMPDQTPIEIQQIRKKFAKDLAEREYFKSPQYEHQRVREGVKDDMNMIQPRGQGMSHAGSYTLGDLTPYIQKCLIPLEVGKVTVSEAPRIKTEEKLSLNRKGKLNTVVVEQGEDLQAKVLND